MTPIAPAQLEQLIAEMRHFEQRVEVEMEYMPIGLPVITCLAFVTNDPLRFMFNFGRAIASGNLDEETYAAFNDTPVVKGMAGRNQVVYFPNIEVEM